MHKKAKILVLLLGVALVIGCGKGSNENAISKNTLVIEKSGEVIETLVDTFEQDYYSVSELKEMVNREAAAYNTMKKQGEISPVIVEGVELSSENGLVMVTQRFHDAAVYQEYTGTFLYYGKVSEAGDYISELEGLTGIRKQDTLSEDKLKRMEGCHVVITNMDGLIRCPYKVAYLNDGPVTDADGNVDTTGMEAPLAVILLNK